jgi:predicted cupin superfamily sugar epimerase
MCVKCGRVAKLPPAPLQAQETSLWPRSVDVRCPKCRHEFRRPLGLVGHREKCSECKFIFVIPPPTAALSYEKADSIGAIPRDKDVLAIIQQLGLQPHPEGGFFRETYRCEETIPTEALPPRYGKDRNFSTAIYYLLTPDGFSSLHRLQSDEVFHFYAGEPVTMLQLHADGRAKTIVLGPDIAAGQQLQVVAPRGVWQGMILNDGGGYALLGATVSPGFDFADFELGIRAALIRQYPSCAALIERLTAN